MLSSWEIEYSQLRLGTDEIRYFGVRLTYWAMETLRGARFKIRPVGACL